MIIDLILLSLIFIALLVSTYTDFKTREVPDWISMGLIFSAIGLRIIYSSLTFQWFYLLSGIFGLVICTLIGYAMFYAGQWGGGDSKLIMGIGAALGIPTFNTPLLLSFVINAMIVGAIYGLLYSIILAIIHRKKFIKNFKKSMYEPKIVKLRKISIILALVAAILIFILSKDPILNWTFISLIAIAYLTLYLMLTIRVVEKTAMFKMVNPNQLTEGDWIAKNYSYKQKHLCGPTDLGISKSQINTLVKLHNKGIINKIKIQVTDIFIESF